MAIRVAVDAGHGSNTAGKRTAPFNKNVDVNKDGIVDVRAGEQYREHYANVMVCRHLYAALQRCGIEPIKVAWNDANAKDDPDVSLSERQRIIRNSSCKLSISVHFNASGNGESFNGPNGVGIYIHDRHVGDSRTFANTLLQYLVQGTRQVNRGVEGQALALCNCSTMDVKAAALVEVAFMTNEREAQDLMANEAFCIETAEELCKGTCKYLGITYVTGNGKPVVPTPPDVPTSTGISPLSGTLKVMYTGSDGVNVRSGAGTQHSVIDVVHGGTYTVVGISGDKKWYKLKSGGFITTSTKYVSFSAAVQSTPTPSPGCYEVRVDTSDLNIRKGPGTNNAKTGATTGKGVFTIIEERSGVGSKKGWGKLRSGAGWIALDYTTRI